MPPGIEKILLKDLNSHLRCILCGGYYIDATTIVECLHSFCKTCIVRYLETQKFCPICDVQVHKTRPLLNIRSDQTLQDIVYKLVPGLFKSEMKRRREFYAQHPEALNSSVPTSSEGRGEVLGGERIIFTPEDEINISLECCPPKIMFLPRPLANQADRAQNHRRYLRCPGGLTVAHLKKLLRAKYGLSPTCPLNISYVHDYLDDKYTMMDLAYIYSWRRNGPLRLFYQILEPSWKKRKPFPGSHVNVIIPVSKEAHGSGSNSQSSCHKSAGAAATSHLPHLTLIRTLSPIHETQDSGINSQSSDTSSSSGNSPSDDDSGELQIVLDDNHEANTKTNNTSSSSSINNTINPINQVKDPTPQPFVPRDKLQEAMIASDLLDIQVI